ncbi:MAG: hypothetical protein CSA86_00245 [Arcobacter sp.]|nr:MAG: hypothetical protein CSA86_00245 [Arcobacter sp.]
MRIFILLCLCTIMLFASKLTKGTNYVVDDKNKLMWQDTKDNIKVLITHNDAIEYCKNLRLNSFSDWQLPTREQIKTIIDKTRVRDQLMINKAFRYVRRDGYWLQDRTWIRNFGKYAYFVYLKSGSIYYQNRSYKKHVRCVRKIQ